MSKFKIGTKVFLKPSYAKWHLDHPEIYGYEGDEYETETLLHLMVCMGVPVTGVIKTISDGFDKTYGVTFRQGNLSMFYYVEQGNICLSR